MFCQKCGAPHNNEHPFCTECGAVLQRPPAPVKKGSLWPPLIFLAVMLIVGIIVFLTYPADTSQTALSETPWFQAENGCLSFDAALYSGSPKLTVPEGITGLADDCFSDCDQLSTVLLPDSLTEVGDRAFAYCDGLRGIKLPDGVTQIGDAAFMNCGALEALAIPATVETIGSGAFDGCGALRHIFFEGTQTQWVALYPSKINADTTIYCADGTFLQEDIES